MSEGTVVQRVRLEHPDRLQKLFGASDENLAWLERTYGVQITVRDEFLVIRGPGAGVAKLTELLEDYNRRVSQGQDPTIDELRAAAQLDLREDGGELDAREEIRDTLAGRYTLQFERKSVSPKTPGQQAYVRAIEESSLTFG